MKLVDINDYISPNQSCVKSLVDTIKNNKGTQIKKITLDDCLSCTGCITSSESLLINNYSLENHFSLLKEKYKADSSIKLGLISYQSLESFIIVYKQKKNLEKNLLSYYNEISNIIATILDLDFILPLNDFIIYSLNLCYNEFISRKKNHKTTVCSECPGWVCYAEKKIGKICFEHMSKIKSPHEISAIIIKTLGEKYFKSLNKDYNTDNNLYICSIMSCFDKKIEPIKSKNSGINNVISSIELEEKFKNFLDGNNNIIQGIKNKIINLSLFKKIISMNNDIMPTKEIIGKEIINKHNDNDENSIINLSLYNFIFNENYSSNFYIEYFIYKIKKENINCFIERKQGKNIDSKEIIIYKDEAKLEIIYKFLISYGLRNIQNIVRMIKSNKIKYDYIEIMACPGGCINGAGQIRVEKSRDEVFNNIEKGFIDFKDNKNNIDIDLQMEKSVKEIEKTVEELNIDKNIFEQFFKEADFSKSDLDW